MNASPKPTGEEFADYIESRLNAAGYKSINHDEYDRRLCLLPDELLAFIKETQNREWQRISESYRERAQDKLFTRVSREISKRGIVDVLRNKVNVRGLLLNLCYFEPKGGLNPPENGLHPPDQDLFAANRFALVRRLHYSSFNNNSVDMVLFINGLPLATLELKNQLAGQTLADSQNLYKYCRDLREPLFQFMRCLVHFCVDTDRISLATKLARGHTIFLPFNRGIENPPPADGSYRTEYLWREILPPAALLGIVENFVYHSRYKSYSYGVSKNKVVARPKEVLVFPRYHQLDLIGKLCRQLRQDGPGRKYLIQHTTGSGKSYSIGWLAHTLSSLYLSEQDSRRMFDSVIVVTDRRVLDSQLRKIIASLQKVDDPVALVDEDARQLKQYLEQGKPIITATIQKFPVISAELAALADKKFAVIIDEVHSSQAGDLPAELKETLTKFEHDGEYDYEQMLKQELQQRGRQQHISYLAFSGAPTKTMLELFGAQTAAGNFAPFHSYSLEQSIREGFTLDVLRNYTSYERYFQLRKIFAKDGESSLLPPPQELLSLDDSHPETIKKKTDIILDHWLNHAANELRGIARGMIVVPSRLHCVRYFQEVNRQLEEQGASYRALVAFSGEVSLDGELYTEQKMNNELGSYGEVSHAFKHRDYRLLIAANKFQTGFDEPLLQSLYIDKRMQEVQCVQTLSRLNRMARGKGETFALDFVNDPQEVRAAFQMFYQTTLMAEESDPNILHNLKKEIDAYRLYTAEELKLFCEIFYDPEKTDNLLQPILSRAAAKFAELADEDERDLYRGKVLSYIRTYGYLSQVANFEDIELEQTFFLLNYLYERLPKNPLVAVGVLDAVDLEPLRVQKKHAAKLTPAAADE